MITEKRYLHVLSQRAGTFRETDVSVEEILEEVQRLAAEDELNEEQSLAFGQNGDFEKPK